MKIYTSYYAYCKNIPNDIIRISIAGKAPKGYKGIEYKKLAPKIGFFLEWKKNHNNDFYISHYYSEVLKSLKASDVYTELCNITNGQDCVLLCYEKPESFCHRHIVARWFYESTGIVVEEYIASKHSYLYRN